MLYWLLLLLLFSAPIFADELTHKYEIGEEVIVYANKVGPFNNPLETYAYFEMPGCPPASWEHKFPTLGEALVGDELYKMNTPVHFRKDTESAQTICKIKVTQNDADKWSEMIREQYWFQLYADNLPMWATVGKMSGNTPLLFTHHNFSFAFNDDRIVGVKLTAENPRPLIVGGELILTYSATFSPSTVQFSNRFARYLDTTFFEHRIHWFSIFNSFMMVIFLAGLVLTILSRTLRADYARLAEEQERREQGREEWSEDAGWKQLHADVFRVPPHPEILCALLGTGWQLVTLCFTSIGSVVLYSAYDSPRGNLLTFWVLTYALSSWVAGFFSATQFSWYSQIGPAISPRWIRCTMITACLFPCTVMGVGFLLNFVAVAYDSAQAIPFGGMVVVVLLWALVCVPLVVIGTVMGRHRRSAASTPIRIDVPHVNQIPRLIPVRPWYRSRSVFIVGGGVLPFGSIFIELYFVFTSFWNYKLYYVYGFMFLVLVILILVAGSVSVVSSYLLLNSEDWRWPWTTFSLGASTAGYVFLYSVYFYIWKTKMSGFFMMTFYFTYMVLLCFGFAILCGTVSFVASSVFITKIFKNVKTD